MDRKLDIHKCIVLPETFDEVVESLARAHSHIALDTETTGLRIHHGDKPFSLILAVKSDLYFAYYFNFNTNPDPNAPDALPQESWQKLQQKLFSKPEITWYIHNAKFDLAVLKSQGCSLAGQVHCTRAMARVENNEHISYSLDNVGKRLGYAKDDAVEKYIKDHSLWEWVAIPGKSVREKNKFYDRVPFEIIFPYACTDAALCLHIAESQTETLLELNREDTEKKNPGILQIVTNERKLTKLVLDMEYRGLKIDHDYSHKAALYEASRMEAAKLKFFEATGKRYKSSPKLFEEVFLPWKDQWEFTEKKNPSFESDTLKKFKTEIADIVLEIRDAKSKQDFFNGFLWYADKNGFIHPTFNPDGTATGRFSSSEPNFQNLTSEDAGSEWS